MNFNLQKIKEESKEFEIDLLEIINKKESDLNDKYGIGIESIMIYINPITKKMDVKMSLINPFKDN